MSSGGFLTATWRLVGIEAPKFIWAAAAFLALLTFYFLIRLLWRVRRERRSLIHAAASVKKVKAQVSRSPGRGLPASIVEQSRQLFERHQSLASIWAALESVLVCRRNAEGQDDFWLSDTSEHALSEDAVLSGRINRSFYSAFPGIVTGLGLLFTFIAILIALLDVHEDLPLT